MTTDTNKTVLAGSEQPDQPAALAGGAQASRPPGKAKKPAVNAKRTRERLVLLCMGLVTAACAATLYALLNFSVSSAVLCGGLIWAALMTLHMQIKKNAEIAHLKAELARLEGSGSGVMAPQSQPQAGMSERPIGEADASAPPQAPPRARAPARRPPVAAPPAQSPEGGKSDALPPDALRTAPRHAVAHAPIADELSAGPQTHPRWEMPAGQPRATDAPGKAADARTMTAGAPAQPRSTPALETALWPGTSLSVADPMRDQWAFRPKDVTQAEPPSPYGTNEQIAATGSIPSKTSGNAGPSSIDADLEMVQRKIKALADEVNAAEQNRDRHATAGGSQASDIEKSIGALKATADTMRERPQPSHKKQARQSQRERRIEPSLMPAPAAHAAAPAASQPAMQSQNLPFDLMIPATAERIAVSDPASTAPAAPRADSQSDQRREPDQLPVLELPPLPVFEFASAPEPQAKPNPRLAAIIAAVENGEMDVFLSPIVALQSHQVSHYDVSVRLKAPNGAYLDDAEQELQLAGSDVLALFDTARLRRSAALAQRLDAHNKSGSLLSPVNGPSITNAEFLETFARVYEERDRISNQLVLTFSQADLEQFSPSAWQALSDMHAFGFRFALAKIDHVAMDFAALADRGFAFLRLEADALTKGLPARDRFIGADELCKLLAGAGMTLVADTIDDEAVRARVFGFGVLFGQGRLFGGARQVKLDALPAGSSAAA